ncbi:hypothetical protein [Polluticoccus soli]|uniref:hypothetical protein n=1 Tax=Polluticoccus soli TaxID=3034150 RepID=UPI0023E158FA|nr:hypothetical protein [Flavipsychrobacter sp. JY13-12]
MLRKIFITGIAVYIILLWLSVSFYKERLLFLDHAYYLFEIITTEGFAIFHYRFIAAAIELFPYLAVKASLPLKQVMLAYSVNIVIFHLLCYLVCGLLKDYKAAIGLLLFHVLFATHTFYFTISEMIQATVLLFPLLALVRRYEIARNRWLTAVFIVLLIPVIAFAHPLMIFPVGFMLVFFWLDSKEPVSIRTVLWVGGVYAAVLLFKNLFLKEPYDAGAMGNLRHFQTLFPDYINLHSNKNFILNCLTRYYWIPLGSAIVIALYTQSKQWGKLALFVVAMLGYLLLINVSYPNSNIPDFYTENLYTPLAFFLALPLAFDVLPALLQRRVALAYALFGLIAVTGLVRIYAAHKSYTTRVNWLRHYVATNEGKKIMASEKHAPMDTLLMSWATPYEFWLISTEERNRTASIIFTDKLKEVSWGSSLTYDFVTQWGTYSYDSLDKRYFKFADSFATYTVMP